MKQKKLIFESSFPPVKIVGDGIIASADHLQGRAVPVIIVDAQDRADISDIFLLHRDLGRLGNVRHAWGKGPGSVLRVYLHLAFMDPVCTDVTIDFALPENANLIEVLLRAECFYLQSGKLGDRISNTAEAPRILVETLSSGFEPYWREIHLDLLMAQIRNEGQHKGISRSARKRIALERLENIWTLPDFPAAKKGV